MGLNLFSNLESFGLEIAYPALRPAIPKDFENVLVIIKFLYLSKYLI